MNLIEFLGVFLLLSYTADSSLLDPVIENVRHIKATHPPDQVSGMWKKKMLWKPRWIKEWKSSNVLKPVWKKFWGPVIIREWVPIPKPPPQWDAVRVNSPGHPFSDVNDPPAPNFNYLQKTPVSYTPPKQSHSFSFPRGFPGGNQIKYKAPHLPITTGYKSQAETYSGQSSYGSQVDNSAYDLNPPVEQYNQEYNYGATHAQGHHVSVPPLPIKPTATHSHIHHHSPPYSQHHVKSNSHPHSGHAPHLTRFPPDWNSWEPIYPKPSGLAQATSAIVTKLQPTTIKPHEAVDDHLLSQGLLPADNDFIQQAALVSEFHYSENPLERPSTSPPFNPSLPPLTPHFSYSANQTQSQSEVFVYQNDSNHVLPLKHNPVQHPSPPHGQVPDAPGSSPSPATVQTHAGQHKPAPASSHNPKPVPQYTPSLIPAFLNHAKHPVSSFHHSPNPIQSHKPTPVLPSNHRHSSSSSSTHSSAHIQQSNPAKLHPKPSPNNQNPIHPRMPTLTPPQTPNSPPKSSPPKKTIPPKPESVKNQKLHFIKPEVLKVPDFKALPSTSVEAFHFIEGFPSNQTLTKAALIGNINHTGVAGNQVEIIAARPNQKEIPAYVTKLAQAIVTEHLKKIEANNSNLTEVTTTTTTTTSEAPTEKATVTIVYPSTNAFVRKTLKAYLSDESSEEKSTKVFVVTPVPQEKIESSQENENRV